MNKLPSGCNQPKAKITNHASEITASSQGSGTTTPPRRSPASYDNGAAQAARKPPSSGRVLKNARLLYPVLHHINYHLVKWIKWKYKKTGNYAKRAIRWLGQTASHQPELFAHRSLGGPFPG
jgi:hypothetical protein